MGLVVHASDVKPPTSGGQNNGYDHLQLVPSDDGTSLLLDVEYDRIVHLNRVASEMWKLLSEEIAEAEIVSRIAGRYEVSESRVAEDLKSLRERISDLRLQPAQSRCFAKSFESTDSEKQISYPWYGDSGKDRPQPKYRTVLAAIAGLAMFDLILRFRTLKVLCSYVNSWPVSNARVADPDIQGKICSAVERACIWYPKKAFCLQRSAVTACLLRKHGVPAQMRIGIRPMPFMAHAWVEIGSSVVNDWPGVQSFYNKVAAY